MTEPYSPADHQLPLDRQPAIRLVTMPADTNPAGDVFGGWLMSQVDLAGSIPAVERAGGRVVTIAVNHFEFHRPVYIGDVVSLYADVVRTGKTSITVAVEVYAQRYPDRKECVRVTEAALTYVAVDDRGKPRLLPPPSHGEVLST